MTIQPQDIDSLIELFESSDWDEMHLKVEGFELFLSTDPNRRVSGALQEPPAILAAPAARQATPGRGQSVAGAAQSEPALSVPSHWVAVTAPNLGTFYRAPKPGAAPFVEIGQTVEPDNDICLIEVMKLFTTLKAGIKGIVRRVCVKDAAMVEFGETLFYIEPG
jgi:acetyl-CoA carboxylase biotin carboxyl carrier protein